MLCLRPPVIWSRAMRGNSIMIRSSATIPAATTQSASGTCWLPSSSGLQHLRRDFDARVPTVLKLGLLEDASSVGPAGAGLGMEGAGRAERGAQEQRLKPDVAIGAIIASQQLCQETR
eukprot:2817815-Rhodomonas_salina.1